ncbi:tail assembly chaperone [Bacillus gobiensis]|uniref:tail assembly chaperone n=1 Tax=Bacillus gobiensis TaxID=1441095 RepID=UPI003D1C8BD6
MAFLTIGDKQYEAKAAFKFEMVADKKYGGDNELTGLESIYQKLMSYKPSGLLAFWDCATAHYSKKEQPSVELIADTIEQIMEQEYGADERLFQEAFRTLDESGFFKLQLKEYWKNIDMIEKMVDENDEKEIKQAKAAKEMFTERRKELLKLE